MTQISPKGHYLKINTQEFICNDQLCISSMYTNNHFRIQIVSFWFRIFLNLNSVGGLTIEQKSNYHGKAISWSLNKQCDYLLFWGLEAYLMQQWFSPLIAIACKYLAELVTESSIRDSLAIFLMIIWQDFQTLWFFWEIGNVFNLLCLARHVVYVELVYFALFEFANAS